MHKKLSDYLVPGLVIQAILVGGGYSTGRELVEFFLLDGPASGLLGIALTALLFSLGAMICFELARRHRCYDYNTFMRLLLGRYRFLFEAGYIAGLILVLAVVSAAAGELLLDIAGWPLWLSSIGFMGVVGFLVFFGNKLIERVISAWSVFFYIGYGVLFVIVLARFGSEMGKAIVSTPVDPGPALWNGLSYTAYNIPLIPVLIFVARRFETRGEALLAGALAGPLILLPGLAFLLSLSAFYPAITQAPLPVAMVLAKVGNPLLSATIQLIVLGALTKTGVGLLHGLNERMARSFAENGKHFPAIARSLVSLAVMILAIYAASAVGLVDLIGQGYRFTAIYFLIVLIIPLATIGIWQIFGREHPPAGQTSP